MNITVLGAGRWGSFIAWYLKKIRHNVVLWDREFSEEQKTTRKSGLVSFPPDLTMTQDLSQALSHAQILVISISAQALRSFLQTIEPKSILQEKTVVLCMKGLEEHTGKRLSQILEEVIVPVPKVAIWVGPGHVQDFLAGTPNCMIIDSKDDTTKQLLIQQFTSPLIRFYYGTDLIGNEIGAAAKNTIGIAAGMLDGMNLGCLKGALMSRGTREIARLLLAAGGKETSAYGLAHLGDYQATLFSPYSNNRLFGEMFVKGETCQKLCEGVASTKALLELEKLYQIDLPICNAVNSVIQHHADPQKVLSELFLRSLKKEV